MKAHGSLCLLFLLGLMLQAGDFRWVKAPFQWHAGGVVATKIVDLQGEPFRIHYSSRRKAPMKITLVDASQTARKKSPKTVVDSSLLATAGYREYSGYQQAYLVIEGDPRGWDVSLDLYLDSLQEWRLKTALEDEEKAVFRKRGFWTGEGTQTVAFEPGEAPWRITAIGDKPVPMKVTVQTADETVLFQRTTQIAGGESSGWIHSIKPVTITVEAAPELSWTLEAAVETRK